MVLVYQEPQPAIKGFIRGLFFFLYGIKSDPPRLAVARQQQGSLSALFQEAIT